ncbi:MAG: THUMP domain-containing class I SAM-dependent RNA methyltransferase [Saccharofermentanales bacterium]
MQIILTTHFGVESLVKDELLALGYTTDNIKVLNGQVILTPDADGLASAVARCNVWVRTAERVLIGIAEAKVQTFDELFDFTKTIPWEDLVPPDWAFHVNGYSRKSALFGIPACQGIIKKAIVDRLSKKRGVIPGADLPEDELTGLLKIQFSIVDDIVTFMIDTSGNGLHKRGYRPLAHIAPIKETLAAALVILSRFTPFSDEGLVDPFCGSGTIPVEAALIAMNIAPGINRNFSSEKWPVIGVKAFADAREEAMDKRDSEPIDAPFIFGSDIDEKNISLSRENAARADVSRIISFRKFDATALTAQEIKKWTGLPKALIIANPPYGERILDVDQARALFGSVGRCWLAGGKAREDLRISIIAPYESFEADFGGIADKRRKLYNGMIPCNMFHYFKHIRK